MTGYSVRIDIDLSALQQDVLDKLTKNLSHAMRFAAKQGAYLWKDAVEKSKLSPYDKEGYVNSIRWAMTGPLAAEITADYRHADAIEDGRPARDMKDCLQTSRKTRISHAKGHEGQHYLIIPFRHNVPGYIAHAKDMPPDIYRQAKGLEKSFLLPPGTNRPPTRVSGHGYLVPQHSYDWGGKLAHWKRDNEGKVQHLGKYAGMVRMNTSARFGKSSAYMTFRAMGEWSTGWVMPAKPGLKLASGVEYTLKTLLDKIVWDLLKNQ